MKKLEPASRSMSCMTPAASSGGKARSSKNEVTSWAQTKNGRRKYERPGARSWIVVTMKLIEPSSDEVIRKIMPMSHIVWPWPAMIDSGAYEVHPDCAAPPGTKKLASMVTPPRKYDQ